MKWNKVTTDKFGMFCFGTEKKLYSLFLTIVFTVIGFLEILDGYSDSPAKMDLQKSVIFAAKKRFSGVQP